MNREKLLKETSPEFVKFLREEGALMRYLCNFDKTLWLKHSPVRPINYIFNSFHWKSQCESYGYWSDLNKKWGDIVANGNMTKDAHYEELCDLGAEDEEKPILKIELDSSRHMSDEEFKVTYGVSRNHVHINWYYNVGDRCYYRIGHPDLQLKDVISDVNGTEYIEVDYEKLTDDSYNNSISKSKYTRKCNGVEMDVYDVLKAFEVKCPALQHLIKKALCAGLRGHKNQQEDLQDILSSAKRAVELNEQI